MPKGIKSYGQRPEPFDLQKQKVNPRSGPYLLVTLNTTVKIYESKLKILFQANEVVAGLYWTDSSHIVSAVFKCTHIWDELLEYTFAKFVPSVYSKYPCDP